MEDRHSHQDSNVEQMFVDTPIEAVIIGDDIWWCAYDTYTCAPIHVRTFRATRSKVTGEVLGYVINGAHVLTPGRMVIRRRKYRPAS